MDRSQYFGSVIPRTWPSLLLSIFSLHGHSLSYFGALWQHSPRALSPTAVIKRITFIETAAKSCCEGLHFTPFRVIFWVRADSTTWHERSHKKVLPQARKATQRPASETIKARTWFTRKLMTGAIGCYWLVRKICWPWNDGAQKQICRSFCGLITAVYFAPRKWRNPFFNCYWAAKGILVKTSRQQKKHQENYIAPCPNYSWAIHDQKINHWLSSNTCKNFGKEKSMGVHAWLGQRVCIFVFLVYLGFVLLIE